MKRSIALEGKALAFGDSHLYAGLVEEQGMQTAIRDAKIDAVARTWPGSLPTKNPPEHVARTMPGLQPVWPTTLQQLSTCGNQDCKSAWLQIYRTTPRIEPE